MSSMELSEFMRKHRAQSDKFEYDFDYVTAAKYADMIGKTANTVRRYMDEGRLEYICIGSKKLIKVRRDQNGERLLEENRLLREENAALRERLSVIRQLVDKN